jgi:hypothetical protein
MSTTSLSFAVDKNIIYSLIKSQAGSPAKAFLELVMNSIDAGASKVEITLDKNSFSVIDDGKGFSSEDEIHNYFKTFGTPHEEGDAIYGKFRMGRGQIMAFTKNVWRTNSFQMSVDILNNGLDFDFTKNLDVVSGVSISGSFYQSLSGLEYNDIISELKSFLKFSQIETFINGVKVNKSLDSMRWTLQTDEAYIKVKDNSNSYTFLEVYNLGVLVCRYPSSKFGFSGTIVSKQQLAVNFARNDILITQCKVWKKIVKDIKSLSIDNSNKKISLKKNLSFEERKHLASTMLEVSLDWSEVRNYPLFTDIVGKSFTFNKLLNSSSVSVSSNNSTLDEKIYKDELALVLTSSTFDLWGVETISDLKSLFIKMLRDYNQHSLSFKLEKIHFIDINSLRSSFNSDVRYLKDKQLTLKQLGVIKSIRKYNYLLVDLINSSHTTLSYSIIPREIFAGESDIADAWTDGSTRIAINKQLLKYADLGISGWSHIAYILIHEYLHTDANNLHDLDFYENFHNIISHSPYTNSWGGNKENPIVRFSKKSNSLYIKELNKHDYNISERCLSLSSITKTSH